MEKLEISAQSAINNFLQSQINKKTEKEQKQLAKAREDNDYIKISTLSEKIADIESKFQAEIWLDNAVNKMAKQLKFGTHISKGIHPDAKGDNVSFQPTAEHIANLPQHIIGSHSINSQFIDANGNAAALPLASFFDFQIDDNYKIKDLILQDNTDFISSLHADKEQAITYQQTFKSALLNNIEQPISHERNKQTLWVNNAYSASQLEDLNYTAIVPLYPSVFTFEIYQKINELRYSEENKLARENRYKKPSEPQMPYVSMFDLATVQLGGTKPQNVSQLMSKQGGRNYLLPSLPPPSISRNIDDNEGFRLSKFAKSIFSKPLKYQCQKDIKRVFEVVEDTRNNVDVRDKRKNALDVVLQTLFSFAEYMRTALPAGWSKDYKELSMAEKYWLDPMRAELEGEEEFAQIRKQGEWIDEIINSFASWLNALLKEQFPQHKNDIADTEFIEWEREIEDMKKQYQRSGKGVFL